MTTVLANYVGIGRGVDLIQYSADLFFLYILFLYFIRIKNIERKLTLLIRETALKNPIHTGDGNGK
jgi:hypothetical protein